MDKKKIERTVVILLTIALVVAIIVSGLLVFYTKEVLKEAQKWQEELESKIKENEDNHIVVGGVVGVVVFFSENSFHGEVEATLISAC